MQQIILLVGEQITPLKILVHKDIKTLYDAILRAKSNHQSVCRESLLHAVAFQISDQLTATELWNKDWEDFDNG